MVVVPRRRALLAAVHYTSYTEARSHFKDILDAAEQGRVATVRRDAGYAAVVDAGRLRHALALLCTSKAEVVREDGSWSAFFPGLPIAADGASFDEAIDELIDALREYAEDWQERLLNSPNHRDNWGLVQLISLSDDAELRQWVVGAAK
jgi:predicted RNase H-like HicB family nuclease